jgi:nicotinamidase-related amidase
MHYLLINFFLPLVFIYLFCKLNYKRKIYMRKIGNKLRTKRQRLRKTNRKYKKQNRRTGRKQNRRTKRVMRGGNYGKTILLIIDPQNGFSPDDDSYKGAKLPVPGALKDYKNIIDFINTNSSKINEIHVSLDTHTPNHIGNPGFWLHSDNSELDTNDTFSILSLNGDKIMGNTVIPGRPNSFGGEAREYIPKNLKMLGYVKDYINFFSTPGNKHGLSAFIWDTHCIERTPDHEIHSDLQEVLNADNIKSKVKYHIKGQNNMTEMYSIFSAEKPFGDAQQTEYGITSDEIYGGEQIQDYAPYLVSGVDSYEDTLKYQNLDTTLNENFMQYLLGTTSSRNLVLVCGEAKTHCVKSSTLDLLEYQAGRNQKCGNIVLLQDCTSPIPGAPDDLVTLVKSAGGRTVSYATGIPTSVQEPTQSAVSKIEIKYVSPFPKEVWKI